MVLTLPTSIETAEPTVAPPVEHSAETTLTAVPVISTSGTTVESSAARPEALIEVKGLVKRFGDFTAVKGIDFRVEEGEIFGFLGPNGAGKSTTIKIMCTLLQPTSGQVNVAGYDVMVDPSEVRKAIGIVFQDNSLDSGLTAQENLEFHCMVYKIPRAERKDRIDGVLELMELTEFRNRIVKTYSGGMRRRLEIARGLLHEPRLLVLDEPTVGLDPQTRNYIWQYVRELRQQHHTAIFMTTHYMDEAENCDRIAIIDHGEIVALDTPTGLKKLVGDDRVALTTRDNSKVAKAIQDHYQLVTTVQDGHVSFQVPNADRFVPQLLVALPGLTDGIVVESMEVRPPSLEDVFLKLTGRLIREEDGNKDERRLSMARRGRL